MSFQNRKSTRYELAQPEELSSVVTTADDPTPIKVRINNISTGGLQLVAPNRLNKSDRLDLSLRCEDGFSASAIAIVRWAIIDGTGWIAGCQFEQPLEAADLDQLASVGVLDRRQHHRIPTMLDAQIAIEGIMGRQACQITDYSNGGLNIETSVSVVPGQKARVSVGHADRQAHVYVAARWSDPKLGTVGFEFLREDDREAFLTCLEVLV
ncbi:MAG: PilZ domain-containing protein [Planctomycetaceae bacterium]